LVVYALQRNSLGTVTAVESLTYVLTPIAARLFGGEPITARGLLGAAFIVVGIVIFCA
jgi:drug/metabolite transporter (DMT)-like permease